MNKFDIHDEAVLREVENTLTSANSIAWLHSPRMETFDFSHYLAIHKFLFEDLYDWAGQIRTVNIEKKGTSFCPAAEIRSMAERVFAYLKQQNLLCGMERAPFLDALVDFYCSTNYLHPFREGNGRTQRIFISQLTRYAGYPLNFDEIDGDLLMIATVQAAHGVTNLLRELFELAI